MLEGGTGWETLTRDVRRDVKRAKLFGGGRYGPLPVRDWDTKTNPPIPIARRKLKRGAKKSMIAENGRLTVPRPCSGSTPR